MTSSQPPAPRDELPKKPIHPLVMHHKMVVANHNTAQSIEQYKDEYIAYMKYEEFVSYHSALLAAVEKRLKKIEQEIVYPSNSNAPFGDGITMIRSLASDLEAARGR